MDEGDDHASVHDELTESGGTLIGQSTVPDDKLLDITEPVDREVGCEGGLLTFLADDTQPDIRLLNHGNIVTSIADARNDLFGFFLNVGGYDGFLSGTTTAYADCLGLKRDVKKLLAQSLIGSDHTQSRSVYHEHVC